MAFGFLTSDDIFISYSRWDASTYAPGLADKLIEEGFSCFIDRYGAEPGRELPASLKKKIRKCKMFVLIATERAATSESIEKEIKEFLQTGRASRIIPVDVDGSLTRARWYYLVDGIAPEAEKSADALDEGDPSPSIVKRIEKSFRYVKGKDRLRRATAGTALLLLGLLVLSGWVTVNASNQLEAAAVASMEAEYAKGEAQTAKAEASVAKAEAEAAKGEADAAKTEADKQKLLAAAAAKDAADKAKLAEGAEQARVVAQAAADRQQKVASALQLSNQAQLVRAQDETLTEPSALLALESVNRLRALKEDAVEADQTLRQSMRLLRRHVTSLSHVPDAGSLSLVDGSSYVTSVALSHDGSYLASVNIDVKIWDTHAEKKQQLLSSWADEEIIKSVIFDADDDIVTADEKGVAKVWEGWRGGSPKVVRSSPDNPGAMYTAFSLDGKYFASATGGGLSDVITVKVWDIKRDQTETLNVPATALQGSVGDDQLGALAVSDDGKRVALSFMGSGIVVWDVRPAAAFAYLSLFTKSELAREDMHGYASALAFGPGGRYLAAARGYDVAIWDMDVSQDCGVDAKRLLTQLEKDEEARGVLARLGTNAEFDAARRRVENPAGERERVTHFTQSSSINKIKFSPDGKFLATTGNDDCAHLWNVQDSQEVAYMSAAWSAANPSSNSVPQDITTLAFSQDGNFFALGNVGDAVRVWDISENASDRPLNVSQQPSSDNVVSPGGKYYASAGEARVKVWEVASRRLVLDEPFSRGLNANVVFSPDERYLAVTGEDASVAWQIETKRAFAIPFAPTRFVFSSDGEYIATSTANYIETCRTQNCSAPHKFHSGMFLESIALSPHAKYMAGVDNSGGAKVWTVGDSPQDVTPAPINDAREIIWGSDDDYVVVVTRRGVVDVLQVSTRHVVGEMDCGAKVSYLQFSSRGRLLVAAAGQTLFVMQQSGLYKVKRLPLGQKAFDIAFSPDENYVAALERDNTSEVFDVQSAQRVSHIRYRDGVVKIGFSPDGKYISTVNAAFDDYLQWWLWKPTDLTRETCRRVTRNLRQREWEANGGTGTTPVTCKELGVPPPAEEAEAEGEEP